MVFNCSNMESKCQSTCYMMEEENLIKESHTTVYFGGDQLDPISVGSMRSFPDGGVRLELANRQQGEATHGSSWLLCSMSGNQEGPFCLLLPLLLQQPTLATTNSCNKQHLQQATVATITATRINIQVELFRKFSTTQILRHQ